MGYYTNHELEIVDGDIGLISELRNCCEEASYAIDDTGSEEQGCKWYDHEKDLREFSTKHPAALFVLNGEGEENGDIWREYYRNGKMQRCKAVIAMPKFNPALLK